MSKIVFTRFDSNGESVELKINGDKTWPEVVENFIYFLRGCGYQVNFEDVRDYLTELCGDDPGGDMDDWDFDNLSWPENWPGTSPSIKTTPAQEEVTVSTTAPTHFSFTMPADFKITTDDSK